MQGGALKSRGHKTGKASAGMRKGEKGGGGGKRGVSNVVGKGEGSIRVEKDEASKGIGKNGF